MKTKLTITNVWIWCKVTPYFVPLQTFSHLFLQLVATIVPTGDKSTSCILNVSQIVSILRHITFPQALWKLIYWNFCPKYLQVSRILHIFAVDSVSPQGREGQDMLIKGRLRTLSLESQISQIWIHLWRNATETSTLGVLYPVTIYFGVG